MFKVNKFVFVSLLVCMTSQFAMAELVNGEDLIDPTSPLNKVDQSLLNSGAQIGFARPALRVSSILIRGETKIAVINDQRVEAGDQLGSAKILSVTPAFVSVEIDGEVEDLYLYQNSIKSYAQSEG